MKYLTPTIAATTIWAACLGITQAGQQTLQLTGAEEVPAITTTAGGVATLDVAADGSVTGGIMTTGINGTAAHIHMGDPGASGPAVITLVAGPQDQWLVPEGAKLSAEQYAAFRKGRLYVNVHSTAHQNGEIRAQIAPPTS